MGEKAWFGPRRYGWGLSPVSVEGWLVTALALTVAFWAVRRWPGNVLARNLPAIALVVVSLLKGTAPGGARARAAMATAAGTPSDDDTGD